MTEYLDLTISVSSPSTYEAVTAEYDSATKTITIKSTLGVVSVRWPDPIPACVVGSEPSVGNVGNLSTGSPHGSLELHERHQRDLSLPVSPATFWQVS